MQNKLLLTGLLALATALSCTRTYDVVVIGGGAGGTMAAIEAARNQASVLVVEPTVMASSVLAGEVLQALAP